jgi:site-specific DNA-methyltransferase (cytosine-N4-specific)
VSRAKTSKYFAKEIQLIEKFSFEIQQLFNNKQFFSDHFLSNGFSIPEFLNRDHWFQKNVSYELAKLKQKIENIKNEKVQNLLYTAFSKIIVRVSNQDSEVRYTAKNKNHPNGIVYKNFIETLSNYLEVLTSEKHLLMADSKVFLGDSHEILKSLNSDQFNFIITSPPYINTFDYYLYHKQRMFWLGYDHRPVRKNEIGNHHRIDTKQFDVAKNEYIESMTLIMNELSRVSKQNSYFVMIIGDGIVDGNTIDMSEVIIDICKKCNYTIEKIESVNLSDITRSFNKKFSNAIKKEHSIILKNRK